jgi:ABC-2 type transport system permease protein
MFWPIFTFELAYWFKRPLTLLFFAAFFLMGFFSTSSDAFLGVSGGQIHRNAPFVLASAIGILTAIGQVITTAIAGTGVLRDAQLGSEELLFTTRVSKMGYLVGRFGGAFVVMVAIYAAIPLGLLLGELMPWVPADRVGPVSVVAVVQPFLLIALPNLLFVSALLFAVGALTRKLFAVYITGIVLLVIWQITQQVTTDLDRLSLASLIDPFALSTIDVIDRYWSVAEKNSLLVPLSTPVIENRLLWIAIGLALFLGIAAVFRLRLQGRRSGKRRAERTERRTTVPAIPSVRLAYDRGSWMSAMWSDTRFHFRSIVREPPFLAIAIICLVNDMIGTWYTAHRGDFVRWPVTSLVASNLSNSLLLFTVLLATLYGGELVWRERQLKLDQMQDAMPVPAWVPFGAKLLAVFFGLCVVYALASFGSMTMQLMQGYTRIQPLLYLQIIAVTMVPVAFAIAAFSIGVHGLVNQKFVGHLVIVAYWVLLPVLSTLGLDHRLWQVGRPPDFTYSDMAGWGPYLGRIFTFEGYSIAMCLLVASLGLLLLVRGTEGTWRSRKIVARRRWQMGGRLAVAGFVIAAIALGGAFFYNANELNAYTEVHKSENALKVWEETYKPLSRLPRPRIVAVTVRHDFFPERRAARWSGTWTAINKTSTPVDTLYLALPASEPRPRNLFEATSNTGLSYDTLNFSRAATLILDDSKAGVRLYRFTPPLAPGDSFTLHFAGRLEPPGYPNDAFNNDVSPNGSFMNSSYMPSIGYDAGNELGDDNARQRAGLKPKDRMKKIDDPTIRDDNYISMDADWITFDETTCTSPDQISIAPGYLDREWNENGRHCFHYAMDRPILDFYATLSGRYAVQREDYKGVKLEIYYNPAHTFALPSMMQAAKDGLDYYSANFSPYLYRQYRIIEFPRYQGFAQAFPNTIPYSEDIGFVYRKEEGDDKIDFAYFVTAHELAHQWWGHQLVGGNGQGATLFSEGLAEYSALTAMEKRFGREAAQKFLRRELDGYLRGRGTERKKEVPLLFVENQPYIHYQKGSLAFYALRDYIGEDAMNRALRAFLGKWALKGPPYATARDLYAELDAVTPDSLKYVLTDLFTEMTFYDNKADTATTTKRADGSWAVHLVIDAKKFRGDSVGTLREIPMADYVDVGVFGGRVPGQKLGEPLLVKKVKITQAVTVLDFVVPKEPLKAGIDPYNKLIDRTPEDNVTGVKRQ